MSEAKRVVRVREDLMFTNFQQGTYEVRQELVERGELRYVLEDDYGQLGVYDSELFEQVGDYYKEEEKEQKRGTISGGLI